MTEKEKFNAMLEFGYEKGKTAEEWYVSLLSSIASSLAIIADSVRKEDDEHMTPLETEKIVEKMYAIAKPHLDGNNYIKVIDVIKILKEDANNGEVVDNG